MLDSWNIFLWEYEFLAPHWLWTLLLVPFLAVYLVRREQRKHGEWKFTGDAAFQVSLLTRWIARLRYALIAMQVVAVALLLIALAKPFLWSSEEAVDERYKNGIDIVLAMDVSLSMYAMDFEPNRLEVSKKVAKEFIDARDGDRIGLVIYAGEAYTACPPTLDHAILKKQLDQMSAEKLIPGTAIGTGLGTAVARLRNDSLPSKVIILLTDGSNNAGEIDPITAANLAHENNIRVYTIGVGSNGEAPTPVVTPFGVRFENMPVEIDEKTLQEIAQIADGKYFRATDAASLSAIYAEIEAMEKRKLEERSIQPEPPTTPSAFLNWAFVLLLISFITHRILFKLYE